MSELKPAFLDLQGAANYVMLGESTIQKYIAAGTFPKQRLLAKRKVGWLVRELDEWAEARPVSDCLPPAGSGHGRAGRQA